MSVAGEARAGFRFCAAFTTMATMATEIELKLCLADEMDMQRVRLALDNLAHRKGTPVEALEQVNYYLDTPRLQLQAQKAMVRVRTVAEAPDQPAKRAVVTLKIRPTLADGVLHAAEHELELPPELAAKWLRAPPARVQAAELSIATWLGEGGLLDVALAPDSWLHVVGAMANSRRVYRLDGYQLNGPAGPLMLELDHARFGLGGADGHRFEVELEHPDAAAWRTVLDGWLAGLEVLAYPATETKYAQLLRLASTAPAWPAS